VGEVLTARKGGNLMVDLQALLDAILEQDKEKALKVLETLRGQADSPTLNDLENAIKGDMWGVPSRYFGNWSARSLSPPVKPLTRLAVRAGKRVASWGNWGVGCARF